MDVKVENVMEQQSVEIKSQNDEVIEISYVEIKSNQDQILNYKGLLFEKIFAQ